MRVYPLFMSIALATTCAATLVTSQTDRSAIVVNSADVVLNPVLATSDQTQFKRRLRAAYGFSQLASGDNHDEERTPIGGVMTSISHDVSLTTDLRMVAEDELQSSLKVTQALRIMEIQKKKKSVEKVVTALSVQLERKEVRDGDEHTRLVAECIKGGVEEKVASNLSVDTLRQIKKGIDKKKKLADDKIIADKSTPFGMYDHQKGGAMPSKGSITGRENDQTYGEDRDGRVLSAAFTVKVEPDGSFKFLMVSPSGENANLPIPPKGGVTIGETPAEAATRETLEESGQEVQLIRGLHEFDFTKKVDKKIVTSHVHFFLAAHIGSAPTFAENMREVYWIGPKDFFLNGKPPMSTFAEKLEAQAEGFKGTENPLSLFNEKFLTLEE